MLAIFTSSFGQASPPRASDPLPALTATNIQTSNLPNLPTHQTRAMKPVTNACRYAAVLFLCVSQPPGVTAGRSVDCVVSDWSEYSACDEINMKQTRTRSVVQDPEGWGRACPGLVDTMVCLPVSCQTSTWGDYSSCDAKGFKTRTRTIIREAQYGGADCRALSEDVKCNPVDCYVSRWGDWSECLADGTRLATRTVLVNPHDGGAECPELERAAPCSSIGSASASADGSGAGKRKRR
ncbi:hypothetical protein BBJ28_00000305 [Nothophytophthora sp. Chile5]|nr:hypothetical protein BBJ28_00000305 [Nothophytophthora sp. Chile5]